MAYAESKRPAEASEDRRGPAGSNPFHDDGAKAGDPERRTRIVPEVIGMLAAAAGLFAGIVGMFLVV